VDAGIKHDSSAVVAVFREDNIIRVALHRIWKPSPQQPLNLEETIEEFLRQLGEAYHLQKILCDPYQLHRSITTLKAAGLPIEEFPQTTGNTTRMGQAIFDLFNGKNIRLYPDGELRQQALNTVAIENPRGWRIAKERASRKIDAIVALSMASVACLDDNRGRFELIQTRFDDPAAFEEWEAEQKQRESAKLMETILKRGYWFPGDGLLSREDNPMDEPAIEGHA